MAYYETIRLVANDTKPEIHFTLLDSNTPVSGLNLDPDDSSTWQPIDITGAVVRVRFRALGAEETLDVLNCVNVLPYEDGKCYLLWNADTLAVDAGTYEGEIELEYSDGRKLTLFDKLKFKVRGDFA